MNKPRTFFFSYFLFFISLFFIQNNYYAQSITKDYQFPKLMIRQYEYEGKPVKFLTFDGAIGIEDYPTLPVFWDKIEVNNLYASYQYTLSNLKYEALTAEEAALIPVHYTFAEPKTHIRTTTDENKRFAILTMIPIIQNAVGQYQKLVSCNIRFAGEAPIAVPKAAGLRNSILSSGTWYKIAVSSTGLHKVTYQDLKELGVPLSGLRSAHIALFGNGGGMIADINPPLQIDDLLETPIRITDNGNGVFDENSFFVFYAQGPHSYQYDMTSDKFSHQYNIYSNEAYYFINTDVGIGEKKRIEKKNSLTETANKTATYFTHYDFYEKDVMNFEEAGREWFDESFSASSSKSYSFSLPEMYDSKSGSVKIRVATTSSASSTMKFSWGNFSNVFSLSGTTSTAAIRTHEENNLPFPSNHLTLTLTYNSSQTSATARLDYIEIQAKCKLKIIGNTMPFAITENIGSGNISTVTLSNATAQTVIWDVTDHKTVVELAGQFSEGQLKFNSPMNQPRLFIAFNGTDYKSVTTAGKVVNQNLHSYKDVDMVMVTHPDFVSEAKRLAQFRAEESKINVRVVTIDEVYNEFSSGAQDPVAIRNYMRYLYDNDSQRLKYLLLVGRPSYDYRGLMKETQIFVPNFQIASHLDTSLSTGQSLDDFFGVLGIMEGDMNNNTVTIGVGRFPVTKLSEAKIAVDKTINASVREKIKLQNDSQISNFGDWRNVVALVADDEDDGRHIKDAELVKDTIVHNFPSFNIDKIYSDAYQQVSYAGGKRYPDVNKAINLRMDKGALAIAYFGHGGGNGWAQERILEITDINSWTNKYNQPLMVTLTCSFGWYDKRAISPAELVFLNEKGGASALCTTSRVSYSGSV
jgi:hypothetical protein